jgi:hypothetical protein
MTEGRTLSPEDVAEIRALNVVLHEDDATITAVSPCPTAAHGDEKVAPAYIVDFACPHGTSTNVFCVPCTTDRRVGRFHCLARTGIDAATCPGTYAVHVRTLTPTTKRKTT